MDIREAERRLNEQFAFRSVTAMNAAKIEAEARAAGLPVREVRLEEIPGLPEPGEIGTGWRYVVEIEPEPVDVTITVTKD